MVKANSITVLCVDDHSLVNEGMATCMQNERDLETVGHLPSADRLLSEISSRRPDVVLLDIQMPGADPFEAVDASRRMHPNVKFLFLTAFVRDGYVEHALRVGASGFFSKCDPTPDVIDGIRQVAAGQRAFGSSVLDRMHMPLPAPGASAPRPATAPTRLQTLTPREHQILRLMGRGLSRSAIARLLHRSPKTIDVHGTNIMRKLDIHDRVDLARFTIREGLVEA